MRKNVVDTHGHKVNANRRVVPDGLGHLELGPHTWGAVVSGVEW